MKKKELYFFEIEELIKAYNSRGCFNKVKKNFKQVFYSSLGLKFLLILIVGLLLIVICMVFLFYTSFIIIDFIAKQELSILTIGFSVLVFICSTIVFAKKMLDYLINYLVKILNKTIVPANNKEENFLKFYCNNKKLNREELYEFKKVYQKLNKIWLKKNNFILEIVKSIMIISFIIVYTLRMNPIIDALKHQVNYSYEIDSISETLRYSFLLIFSLQSIDVSYNMFSFDEVIERYDYILNFGYDVYERKYIKEKNKF